MSDSKSDDDNSSDDNGGPGWAEGKENTLDSSNDVLMPLDPPPQLAPDDKLLSPKVGTEDSSPERRVVSTDDDGKAESEEEEKPKDSDASYADSSDHKEDEEANSDEEEDEEEAEDEDEEERLSESSDDSSPRKPKKKQKLSKEELRELMEAAGEVRRSGRQRATVQRSAAKDSDSDVSPKRKRKRRDESESSDGEAASESEYEDTKSRRTARKAPKRGGGGKKRRRVKSSDEEDDFDSDAARFSTRRAANRRVVYKEAESDEDIDDDDVLEWDEEQPGTSGVEEPPSETIEKILTHRKGRKGAIGSPTTVYHVEDKGDPNADFDAEKEEGERQYLIKWLKWSHIHNTWETEESLKTAGVKGLKKLDNYMARTKDIERWKRRADKDNVEYFECEQAMTEELYENYKLCERIVAHQKGREEDSVEYYVKWSGMPYSECTWEDGALCQKRYQSAIDSYQERRESKTLPRYAQGRGSERFRLSHKFAVLKEQPGFLGGDQGHFFRLRDYQLAGLNWLMAAYAKGNSCILADEMGLGKTIQTCSFLSTLANEYGVFGPFLLIVPLSTMAAWGKEMAQWAPQLNAIVYLGDVSSRETIRQFEWTVSGTRHIKFNACLTTYEILLKDKAFLSQTDWAVIAVDEAHRLKNHESQLYRSLAEFTSQHRLLITGTPLQNSLKELWALLHFIMPNLFESWEDFDYRHGRGEKKGYNSIHRELEPFLLRRVKKDVEKSLPAKVEQILRVDMTAVQKQYYKWILTKNFKELSRGVQKGSQSTLLNIMMELKKCCNHAFLVKPPEEGDDYKEEKLIRASGKFMLLHKLLKQLKEKGHRVLIFSQMVIMLDLLQDYLRFEKLNFQRLDGTMRGELRKQAMDHFNEPGSTDFAFLLSTKAGGLGLNLATADTVIIVDSDWNPQNDLQAQSRAHRIGQTKQVRIYRLVTKNSVEEDIVERAKRKLVLDHLVIQRMDTTGRTVLAKNAVSGNSNNPFNKEELSCILKFGAQELFKEKEGEEQDPEVDIDDILNRAETRETEATNEHADELLSAFKVANFAIDEHERLETRDSQEAPGANWLDIIPEKDRQRMEEEEALALQNQLNLPPRQRNKVKQPSKGEESDEDWGKKRKGRKGSDSEDSEDEEEDRKVSGKKARKVLFGFTEAEVKRFLRTIRKFARPHLRLEAIGNDAGLAEEHSTAEIRQLVDALIRSYKQALTDGSEDSGKKGPSFRFAGFEVPVKPMDKAARDLEPLYSVLPESASERRHWSLPVQPKLLRNWDLEWDERDDAALLRGIYDYGYGSWDSIKMDPDLGLTEKMLPADKKKKPQVTHIVSRADYLLRLIAKQYGPAPNSRKEKKKEASVEENGSVDKEEKPTKKRKTKEKDPEPSTSHTPERKKKEPKTESKAVKVKAVDPEEAVTNMAVNLKFAKDIEDRKSKIFQECVQIMTPVRKAIKKALNPDQDRPNDFNDNLVKVGEHITEHLITVVFKTKPKQLEKWASYLWLFVGNFFEHLDAVRLLKLYRIQKKKKDLEPPEVVKSKEEPELKSALKSSLKPRKASPDPSSSRHGHHHRRDEEGRKNGEKEWRHSRYEGTGYSKVTFLY